MKNKLILGEIIQFLQDNYFSDLEKLRHSYPLSKEILSSGIAMGEDAKTELEFRTDLAEVTLNSIIKKLKQELPKIKSRIKLYHNLAFISSLITTFSSSSILLLLSENSNMIFTYTAAILALFGALITVIAQWKIQTFAKDSDSLMSIYEQLIKSLFDAEEVQKEFQILKKYKMSEPKVNDILKEGNQLCKKVNHLLYLL